MPIPGLRDQVAAATLPRLLSLTDALAQSPFGPRPVEREGLRLDPQVQLAFELQRASRVPALNELGLAAARAQMEELQRAFAVPRPRVGRVEDLELPGPEGPLPARLYVPARSTRGLPLVVYFHGGGFVVGSLESTDGFCRLLCLGARCQVLSVGYRLAPEAPFPAAVDDAVAAYLWARASAAELGADPERIGVGGDSAGANLAAVTCLLARDGGHPAPRLQLLVYPMTDEASEHPSRRTFGEGFLLTRAMIAWFTQAYLQGQDPADPRVSPLRWKGGFEGLPAAVVATAGFDPLRDEGDAYARELAAAGCRVAHLRFESLPHGFVQMAGAVRRATEASDAIARSTAELFGS